MEKTSIGFKGEAIIEKEKTVESNGKVTGGVRIVCGLEKSAENEDKLSENEDFLRDRHAIKGCDRDNMLDQFNSKVTIVHSK